MASTTLGRVLGVDLGERRIGLAIGDETATLASELSVLPRATFDQDAASLRAIVQQRGVSAIVVGLPRSLSGELGWQAQRTLAWVDEMRLRLDTRIETWDERLTTVEATRALTFAGVSGRRQKERIDMTAAAVMLQSYLDSRRGLDGA